MIIKSLLDDDMYKLTMGQLAFNQFPEAIVEYEFKNRGNTLFRQSTAEALIREIDLMSSVRMTDNEYAYLKAVRFLKPTFLEWFRNYRYHISLYKWFKINQNS